MSTKLKALGLGLLTAMAIGAVAVKNASATTGGHFNSPAGTTITGLENSTHNLEFELDSGDIFDCTKAALHSSTGGTVTSITITPNWGECFTTGTPETKYDIHENACTLKFTVSPNPETEHNTVDICDTGGPLIITHPNCLITVEKQSASGLLYKTITANNKHAITLTSTVKFATKYHGGICQLLGTNHTVEMKGSTTVIGENADSEPVDITATGVDTDTGSFDLGDDHTVINGFEGESEHFLEFTIASQPGIRCTQSVYEGTSMQTNSSSITISPNWNKCYTTGSSETEWSIDENGCTIQFTIGTKSEGHNVADLVCPTEPLKLTHPQCTIHIPGQTVTGVAYGQVLESGEHSITLTATAENITTHFESGICQLLGTTQTAKMEGDVTVQGFNTAGEPVDITATGSED